MKDPYFQTIGVSSAEFSASKVERSPEDLRQDIRAQKDAISGTIDEIDERVQRVTDWRAQVGDHPFLAVGAAFVAGGILSAIFRHRPTPQERMMDALADGFEDLTAKVRGRFVSHVARGVSNNVLKVVTAALISKVASTYLRDRKIDETCSADQDY